MPVYLVKMEDESHYVQAKSQLDLLQTWEMDYEGFRDIEEVKELSEEEIDSIMVRNTEYDETDPTDEETMPLRGFILLGDDFAIIASTEF